MSISYCQNCERVVEGFGDSIECTNCGHEICCCCGEPTTGLPDDDPREDR